MSGEGPDDPLLSLSTEQLEALALRFEAGLIEPPVGVSDLLEFPREKRASVVRLVSDLERRFGVVGVAPALMLAVRSRRVEMAIRPEPTLVWSAGDIVGMRSTGMVVEELIARAERSIFVCTYSFNGPSGEDHPLFTPLQRRLSETPGLKARIILGKVSGYNDSRPWTKVRDDAAKGVRKHWPMAPFPEIYIPGPQGHEDEPGAGVVHAKLVVRDGAEVLLTSANLTSAAMDSNVEAGVLVRTPAMARVVLSQFDGLIQRGMLRRLELR